MSRRIVVRQDPRIGDDDQLVVRMNDDRDVANALKLALAEAAPYRVVPGFESAGAVTISCFVVADDVEAQIIVRGTRWSLYGLARVRDLRALGYDLLATNVFDGDEPLPLSDRHVDVIICPYPPETPPYGALAKQERARLRSSLEGRFTTALRAFDPRRTTGDETEIR